MRAATQMRAAAAGRSLVPPAPTTNLLARFIAGTGETVSGGKVTAWADQSGNGLNATQGTNGHRVATDYLGRRVARFDSNTPNGPAAMAFGASHTFSSRNLAVFVIGRFVPMPGTPFLMSINTGQRALGVAASPSSNPFTYYAVSNNSQLRVIGNPQLIGVVASATATQFHTNLTSPAAGGAVNASTGTGAFIGAGDSAGASALNGDIYEVLVYEGTVSASDVTALRAYAVAQYGLRTTAYTKNAVFVGDSITFGAANTVGGNFAMTAYPHQAMLRPSTVDWKFANLASSGMAIGTLLSSQTATNGYFDAACTKNILVPMIGRNDVTTADNSATIYSSIVTYVQNAVTAGWTVWMGTTIASGGGFQPTIDALNAKIRGSVNGGTGPGIVADAGAARVVDFGALPEFDTAADASNTTYYQADGVHPTIAGSTVLADYIAPLIAAA